MVDYNSLTKEDVISNIRKTSDELMDEYEKEEIDKEKICKLMNRQLMQGLFLQNVM